MTDRRSTEKHQWNATLYENQHGFVWQYGSELIEILAPKPNEQILDVAKKVETI